MKTKTWLFILALLPIFAFSQYDKMVETLDDEMETMDNGKLVLRFINAENGTPVDSATVKIEGVGEFTSDLQGKIFVDPLDDKTYTLLFARRGFILATYNFDVKAGTVFSNRFAVSPVFEIGALRVVLDWGRSPADLDLHLVKEGDYHISYQNMHEASDGTARLDRDDQKGFGPETITVKTVDNGATYTCYIKNFSDKKSPGSKSLSKSKAKVVVYDNNQLLKSYSVPLDKKGTTWMVFTIVNGKITDKDEVGNWY